MRAKGVVFWVLVAVAAAMALFLAWEFVMSDKCLDAGGAWDYKAKRCRMTEQDPPAR